MGIFSKRDQPASTPLAPPTPVSTIDLHKAIDLRKETVKVILRKGGLGGTVARVCLVYDKSGSMNRLYQDGVVQTTTERLFAVAKALDDDGTMEAFAFATKACRLPDLTSDNVAGYLNSREVQQAWAHIGYDNTEPYVMEDVIRKYTVEEPSDIPTFILFISDGGIGLTGGDYKGDVNAHIERLLRESSHTNLFWQFIGLGRANYGSLERLDNLDGRLVDNANFFALDDITSISDDDLYQRLLNEYPQWVKSAQDAGISIRLA